MTPEQDQLLGHAVLALSSMLPALIVGALTAWYLGLRLGVIVAIVTAAALLLAAFVPGMTITVYALVIAWDAALFPGGWHRARA